MNTDDPVTPHPDDYATIARRPPSRRAIFSTPDNQRPRPSTQQRTPVPKPRKVTQRPSIFSSLDWSTADRDDVSWLIAVFHPLGRSSTTYRSLRDAANSINGRLLSTRNGFTDYITVNPADKTNHVKTLLLHGWCAFDAFPRLPWTALSPATRKQSAITTPHLPANRVRNLVHKLLLTDHASHIATFDTRHRRDGTNTATLTISCTSTDTATAVLDWLNTSAEIAAHFVQPNANYFNRLLTKAPVTTTFIHELGIPTHVYIKNDPDYPSPRHCVVVCLPSDWPAVRDILNDHNLIASIIDTPPDFTPSLRSRQRPSPARHNTEPNLTDDDFPPLPSSRPPPTLHPTSSTRPSFPSATVEEFHDRLDRLETHVANAFASISAINTTLSTLPTSITNTLVSAAVDAILKNPLFTSIQDTLNAFRADLNELTANNSPPPLTKRTTDSARFKRLRRASTPDPDSQ